MRITGKYIDRATVTIDTRFSYSSIRNRAYIGPIAPIGPIGPIAYKSYCYTKTFSDPNQTSDE